MTILPLRHDFCSLFTLETLVILPFKPASLSLSAPWRSPWMQTSQPCFVFVFRRGSRTARRRRRPWRRASAPAATRPLTPAAASPAPRHSWTPLPTGSVSAARPALPTPSGTCLRLMFVCYHIRTKSHPCGFLIKFIARCWSNHR